MKKKIDKKRVVLTGGHAASTAFVVFEEIKRQGKNWDLYWIGIKSSLEGEKVLPISSIYFPKYGIKTHSITAGRIQRKFTIHTIPSILRIPVGFVEAGILLTKIRPDVVLSFGGFSAFPVVVIAAFLGIPVVIHEQTSVVGRANKYSAYLAKRIAISRETSAKYFPRSKTTLTGNPIPRDIAKSGWVRELPKTPSIFVTGGQSGSVSLNGVIGNALPKLLPRFRIIHQTGIKDENKYKKIKENLESNLKNRYEVYGSIEFTKFNEFFNSATMVISRAGANTVAKILASKKPSILVPLPISYLGEQEKNAIYSRDFGTSLVIDQKELTPERLIDGIDYLLANWEKIRKKVAGKVSPDIGAAEKLVKLIEEEVR